MKKLSLLLLLVFCGVSAQDVKFAAKIANRNGDKLTISGPKKFKQEIAINKDNVFTATFAAPAGLYEMTDGTEFTSLYLKPGYDLTLTMDARQFDESIVYKGKGEQENNFLAQKTLMEEEFQNGMVNIKSRTISIKRLLHTTQKLLKSSTQKALILISKPLSSNQ
ncbi:hypothetical protein [Flavobacterium sp. 3HN19-14]|uniref:hypothetical protein n=1 Tax=Flavobacterium sp. 3HN19-14 TaxID=3448133 RepID=UPI003EE217EF